MRSFVAAFVMVALMFAVPGSADPKVDEDLELVLKSGKHIAVERLERAGDQVLAYFEGGRAMAYSTADVDLDASGLATDQPAPAEEHNDQPERVQLGGHRVLGVSDRDDNPKTIVIVGQSRTQAGAAAEADESDDGGGNGEDEASAPSGAEDGGLSALSSDFEQLTRTLGELDRELAGVEHECRRLTVSRSSYGTITHLSERCREAQQRCWQLIGQIGTVDGRIKNRARRDKIQPGELRKAYSERGLASLDAQLKSARQTLSKDWSDPNS